VKLCLCDDTVYVQYIHRYVCVCVCVCVCVLSWLVCPVCPNYSQAPQVKSATSTHTQGELAMYPLLCLPFYETLQWARLSHCSASLATDENKKRFSVVNTHCPSTHLIALQLQSYFSWISLEFLANFTFIKNLKASGEALLAHQGRGCCAAELRLVASSVASCGTLLWAEGSQQNVTPPPSW